MVWKNSIYSDQRFAYEGGTVYHRNQRRCNSEEISILSSYQVSEEIVAATLKWMN
jgi:hypothetical protein